VDTYESGFPTPWNMEILPETLVDKLQDQIVGFEIEITRLEGKFKLNQNRTVADQRGVIDALNNTTDPPGLEIAKLMARHLAF